MKRACQVSKSVSQAAPGLVLGPAGEARLRGGHRDGGGGYSRLRVGYMSVTRPALRYSTELYTNFSRTRVKSQKSPRRLRRRSASQVGARIEIAIDLELYWR